MNPVGRTLLGVLGLWHGLAAIQNVFEILASSGVAPGLRSIASKNYELIAKVMQPLHPPKALLLAMLAGASGIEAIAAVSFSRGALDGEPSELGFVLSLVLFGSFFLIDDAFDDYDLGARHRAIFTLVASAYAAAKLSEG
jgi:hypothetical protein